MAAAEGKGSRSGRRRARQRATRESLQDVFEMLVRLGDAEVAPKHRFMTTGVVHEEGLVRVQKLLAAALEKAARGLGPEAQARLLEHFPFTFRPVAGRGEGETTPRPVG